MYYLGKPYRLRLERGEQRITVAEDTILLSSPKLYSDVLKAEYLAWLKAQAENMIVVDKFYIDAPKTKSMIAYLAAVQKGKKPLLVLHETNMAVVKSAANIPGAYVQHVDSVNVYDLLNHDQLIATPEAIKKLEEVFG